MRIIFVICIICVNTLLPLLADDTDRHGWILPDTPLCISGYLSARYDKKEYDDPLFDDIAMLLYANRSRYHFLAEAEFSDITLTDPDLTHAGLFVERLQLAYDLDDRTTLTVGKFNSDIGLWNLARISILTDTTSSPHMLERLFPELTTGLLYSRSFDDFHQSISLTLQHNNAIDNRYNNMRIDRHYAIGYSYEANSLTLRLNAGIYRGGEHNSSRYAGIAVRYETDRWRAQAELFHKERDRDDGIPYDGYLQLVMHISDTLDAIVRQEFYKDRQQALSEGISVIGTAYRPVGSFTLKAEYLRHQKLPENRLILSISVLF